MLHILSNYPLVNITGDRSSPLPADYETLDSIVVARAEKEYAYNKRSSLVDEYLSPQQLSPELDDVPPMRKLICTYTKLCLIKFAVCMRLHSLIQLLIKFSWTLVELFGNCTIMY